MIFKLSCYVLAIGAVVISFWAGYSGSLGGLERLGVGALGGAAAGFFFSLGRKS